MWRQTWEKPEVIVDRVCWLLMKLNLGNLIWLSESLLVLSVKLNTLSVAVCLHFEFHISLMYTYWLWQDEMTLVNKVINCFFKVCALPFFCGTVFQHLASFSCSYCHSQCLAEERCLRRHLSIYRVWSLLYKWKMESGFGIRCALRYDGQRN